MENARSQVPILFHKLRTIEHDFSLVKHFCVCFDMTSFSVSAYILTVTEIGCEDFSFFSLQGPVTNLLFYVNSSIRFWNPLFS